MSPFPLRLVLCPAVCVYQNTRGCSWHFCDTVKLTDPPRTCSLFKQNTFHSSHKTPESSLPSNLFWYFQVKSNIPSLTLIISPEIFFAHIHSHLWWWWWFSRSVVSNTLWPMDYSLPGSSVHGIYMGSRKKMANNFLLDWELIVHFYILGTQYRVRHKVQIMCMPVE